MEKITVIGGGIIGLSCAWRLAQRGHAVTLFEARELAAEASWTAAGMLSPGGEFTGDTPALRMALASLDLYDDFVRELREVSGLPIDYRHCGALELALTDAESAELDRRATAQQKLGIRSVRTVKGRFYPDDALVNPREVTAALIVACRRQGVALREHERVERIGPEPTLLAAGAWSSALTPAIPRVSPVRGHLVSYDAPGLRLESIVRHKNTYLAQRTSGVIVAGTTTENAGFDRTIDEAAIRDIDKRARNLIPELPAPSDRWNGFRPAIEGDTPAIGRVQDTSVWTACGHYRNGILLAPETARLIAASFQAASFP